MIDYLNWRYATKQFDSTVKISDENLSILEKSLILTPSSFGLQPWKFIIVKNQMIKDSLVEHSWGQKQVSDCSHLIVICALRNINDQYIQSYINSIVQIRSVEESDLQSYKDMMIGFANGINHEQKLSWAKNQCYIALGNLLHSTANLKIDSCPMEGFIAAKYDEILGLDSSNYTSCVICPVGYRHKDDFYSTLKKVRFDNDSLIEYK